MADNFSTPSSLTLTALITVILISLSSSQILVTGQSSHCSDELVSFSPCLPLTAAPPNNSSTAAAAIADCCDAYSKIIVASNGFCLCYLLRDPPILGFPLNSSKILSLSSLCPLNQSNTSSLKNLSLDSICSAFEASPPLQNAGLGITPSPTPSITQTPGQSPPIAVQSPPSPGLHLDYSQASSATRIASTWFLLKGFIVYLHLAPA